MNKEQPQSYGELIILKGQGAIQAYDGYLTALHYRDHPECMPTETLEEIGFPSNTYSHLQSDSEKVFIGTLRDQLGLTLSMALAVNQKKPLSLEEAERRAEVVDGMQLYLTQVVGYVATKRVLEEGWGATNPRLQQLTNPFESFETLRAIWKYKDNRSRIKDINSLSILAPGYYDELTTS